MSAESALDRGVRVGLGSDVAAGRSFDIRRAIASAYDTALCRDEKVMPDQLIRMATLGGAEALGIEAVTGSLETGKEADFLLLELPDYLDSASDLIAHLAFFHDDAVVRKSFVRGAQVYEAGQS